MLEGETVTSHFVTLLAVHGFFSMIMGLLSIIPMLALYDFFIMRVKLYCRVRRELKKVI